MCIGVYMHRCVGTCLMCIGVYMRRCVCACMHAYVHMYLCVYVYVGA